MGKRIIALAFLILMQTYSCYGIESLKINTSIKPPFSTEQKDGFFDLLLEELFARVGIHVDLVRLPAERAIQMVNDGLSDGDIPRISGLTSIYPDLIEVEESVVALFKYN